MTRCSAREDDVLVCPRPGCRDTVSGVRALTFHLHAHEFVPNPSVDPSIIGDSFGSPVTP